MCFIQFTCTNLDGSQKEGANFLNLVQKEGGTEKRGGGGVPSEKGPGVPTVEETMIYFIMTKLLITWRERTLDHCLWDMGMLKLVWKTERNFKRS